MPNEYLDALNGATGAAPANPYLDTLDQQERAGTAALRGTLSTAVGANPDAVAQKRRVAEYLGYPPAAVEARPQLEQQARVQQIDEATAGAPVTRRKFTDADFAKLAHDDAGTLVSVEGALRVLKGAGTSLASAVPVLNEGAWGLVRAGADALPFGLGKPAADYAARIGGQQRALAADLVPKADNTLEAGFYSGMQSLGTNLLQLPLLIASGGQAAPVLTSMGLTTGGKAYGEARDAGRGPLQSLSFGTSQGLIEAGTEMLGMPALIGMLKPGQFTAKALEYLVKEQGGEQIATHLQDLNEWATLHPEKTLGQYLSERPDAALQTAIATAVGGGGQVAIMKGAQFALSRLEQAQQAEPQAQLLQQLAELAKASKLAQRDPASFEAFVAEAAQDGPVQDVFLSADALMQSGMADTVAQALPEIAQQVQVAAATGGDIRIPVELFASRIATTDAGAALLDHLKTEPGGMSRAEATAYMEQHQGALRQEVERALQEHQGDEAFKASHEAVRTEIRAQLDAAGRFTPQAHEAYATMVGSFYAVQAARLGMTPQELYARYPLRVAAQGVGGEVLNQQSADPVFQEATVDDSNGDAGPGLTKTFDNGRGGEGVINLAIKGDRLVPVWVDNGIYFGDNKSTGGIVTGLYEAAIREAQARGLKFTSDDSVTEEAARVYDALTRRGYEVTRNPAARLAEAPEVITPRWVTDDGSPVFTVQPPLLLQGAAAPRAFFSPSTNTIALLKGADLSSFLHESAHAFLEMSLDMAARLDGAQREGAGLSEGELQVLADANALLRWFGVADLTEWYGMDFEQRRGLHERFAESFEAYLFSGKAPSIELQPVFQRFRAWLLNVYKSLKDFLVGHPEAGKLTDEVCGVFDRMLATTEQIKLAEQGRSMLPLFATAEQAGMTPEEFAAYQALGIDATNEAIQQLQARGLADMQWLRNARSRELRRMQRAAAEKRREVRMEARAEVLQQPVYKAWQFLTGKLAKEDMLPAEERRTAYREALKAWRDGRAATEAAARGTAEQAAWEASDEGKAKYRKPETQAKARAKVLRREAGAIGKAAADALRQWDASNPEPADPDVKRTSDPNTVDPSIDSLLTAIAKLGGVNRESARTDLGVAADDLKAKAAVFGKSSVFRLDGGMSADRMAEALAEYGYLPQGEYTLHDLEERIGAELRGDLQYSAAYDYAARFADEQANEVRNPAALQAGRLDILAVRGLGLEKAQVELLKTRKMTAPEGLHPDVVAELFGFSSGDELVHALLDATPLGEAIEAATDARMLERYGDLATPAAIEQAADAAIHNEARARVIATEQTALARAVGGREQTGTNAKGRPVTRAIVPRAAREFAQQLIARHRVRDVLPGQYAAAEARAARNAEQASKAGKLDVAAAEKRNQLVQHYSAAAAHAALDEVERGLRYLRGFDRDSTRKSLDSGYLDQIDALLERFDLRKSSLKAIDKRAGLAAWLEQQREAGLEPDIPEALKNEAFRKSYRDMTVEEFRGLVDSVKQIEHLARLKHRLLTARDQRAYEAIRDEIAASIEANARGRTADTRTPTTNTGRFVQGLRRFWSAHIKVATLARVMDGGQDGGPVWEHFVRGANERSDHEATMRAEATQALSDILAPVFKLGRMGGKGQWFPSIGRSLNREARLAIALNVGNEGNTQRLLGGEGWTLEQLLPVLQSLTSQEWQAVQSVWDHFERYRPLIAAKEKRVYGKEPAWVEPRPLKILLADGQEVEMRGGYYPIKYDPQASQRAEEHADAEGAKRQLQGAYTSATTKRSFTKSRAEEVTGRPLLYTLAGLYSGVNDVIHDLQWHEWLIDANRLLRSQTIDSAIREHYGPEAKQQFKTWVQAIAEGEKGSDAAVDQALARLRQGISAAGLGFNVMSAAMQPLGLTQSIVRVGAKWVGRSIARYVANPRSLAREVNTKSEFMLNRARTRFRELNELRNQVQDQHGAKERVGVYAYWLMMQAQRMVDLPTWQGAYEKAMAEGHDEERAIALADQAVRDAQGGGQTSDLSAIERGGPAQKLFTVFYSFMNTALNLGVAQTMTADTPAKRAKLAADYLLLFVVPAVLGTLLKDALTPGGGDDEDWAAFARRMLAAELDYLMGLMVVVREFGEAAKIVTGANDRGRDYTGPAGLRLIADTITAAKQVHQGEFDDALRKAVVNVIGDLTGLPSAQFNRTVTGAEALSSGETANPAALAFGFQRQ